MDPATQAMVQKLEAHYTDLSLKILALQVQPYPSSSSPYSKTSIRFPFPPSFTGQRTDSTTVRAWLYTVQNYFTATHLTSDQDQQNLLATLFTGHAANWWRTLSRPSPDYIASFAEISAALLKEYEPLNNDDLLRRSLISSRQTTSVQAYAARTRSTLAQLPGFDPASALFIFVNGLKPLIQTHVRLSQPATLEAAISSAVSIDTLSYQTSTSSSLVPSTSHFPFASTSSSTSGAQPMELGALELDAFYNEPCPPSPFPEDTKYLNSIASTSRSSPSSITTRFRLTPLQESNARKTNLCLFCLCSGHLARDCSENQQKGHAHQG